MLRAVIIDDVTESRQTLADDLQTYCPQITLAGTAESVVTAVKLIDALKPEVIFLDIQLGDGTGFEVLEQVKHKNYKVIFTTGSDRFAIQAIKCSAVDYLLKPIDPDALQLAVKKLAQSNAIPEQIELLIQSLKNKQTPLKRIALNSADRVQLVNVAEVIRCESQGNYTLFYLQDKRQILVTRTLKEFEEMLDENEFIRVHHSHLVNINYLKEFVKTDGGYVVLSDNSQVPVSVRKKEQLLKILGV